MPPTKAETGKDNAIAIERAIFKHTAFAIISCDPNGRVTNLNPAAEAMLGWQAAEVIAKQNLEVFHLAEELAARAKLESIKSGRPVAPGFSALVAEAKEGGRTFDEWTMVRRDGSRVRALVSITPLHDQKGKITGFVESALDMAERRQGATEMRRREADAARKIAEESLHESRRLYEDLVASIPLGVYRLALKPDEALAFDYVSDRFCEITGLDRAAVLADRSIFLNIIHSADRDSFSSRCSTALHERGSFQWEGRAVVHDRIRWLLFESRVTSGPGQPTFWTGVVSDVTDRRDVEEELHHQHSLLEGTLQATADGILAVSSSGEITSYNRQFLELWRVPKETLDTHNISALADYIVQQLSNPAAMQSRIRNFNDASKADTFDTLEFADGRVYERFSRPQLVEGRVVGRVWSFRDVTARHWGVASIRENERKFKMLFDSAKDAILLMNQNVFIDCNQMSEVIYGCPRAQIIGSSPVRFSPEQQTDGRPSSEVITEKIQSALSGIPQSFESIQARYDGTLFNAETSLSRLELRGQPALQVIVRDITARKQAEAAQHDAERLYRTLVNTSPDGICVLDMSGRILFSSPKAMELFYGSSEAVPPSEPSALDLIAKQDRERAAELLRGAINEKSPINERLHICRSDGHEFVAELNGRLLRDGLEVPWGILVIFRDVTDRQNQEDELKGKNSELERFTYTVSHDLRSPLITIKGFAGALLSDLSVGRTDRLEGDLKRIVQAADKMSDLLNGLLELSRVGRIVNPPINVPMDRVVQDVLELLAGTIAQRQAKVAVQPDLPPAYGDARRLREVFQNLIENGLKFSAHGQSPEIEIGCKTIGEQNAYFVRDHGRGIDPRHHESIFGLFNKLDARSTGTGIGLALVRRIVEFHGGKVWVESNGEGQGTTFYFTLPGRKALSSTSAN